VPINRDPLEKRRGSRVRRRKPCQHSAKKKSSLKVQEEHSCPSKSKAYFDFFKSKVGDASQIFIQPRSRSSRRPSTLKVQEEHSCPSKSKAYFDFFKSKVGDASQIFIQPRSRSSRRPSTPSPKIPTTHSTQKYSDTIQDQAS
jgi:hypothetical protein